MDIILPKIKFIVLLAKDSGPSLTVALTHKEMDSNMHHKAMTLVNKKQVVNLLFLLIINRPCMCFEEGKELISKETIEDVDEKNKSITYKFLEGDLMDLFKSMKVTFQIISEGEKNFLKWMYEYEKENANGPGPEILKTFIDEVTSRIDEHFLGLKNASLA